FMIRDRKMQQLVKKEDEPITTYIDRVRQLYLEKNVSTILVLGGVGDYFDVSDIVIQMKNYQPLDVSANAHMISAEARSKRQVEGESSSMTIRERIPIADSISPFNKYGKFAIYAKEIHRINFGEQVIDLTDLEQLVELSQTKALAYAIEYSKRYMDGESTLREVVEHVVSDIEENGLDIVSDRVSGHFAWFRPFELAFVINRLRKFDVLQKNQRSVFLK
ncbi:MAG: ABC-ATPase domain-containing protein, partial [Gammaproteobacteria bacterium]|nr:ABC-ATPase domain-containing protein [Gammaproteobacteria bacterium]